MAIEVKERKEIEDCYKWDLTVLFQDDSAWEEAFSSLPAVIDKAAAFEGKLTESPEELRSFYDAATEAERALENVFSYASLRSSEDGRDEAAQSMYSRAYSMAVRAEEQLSFADPEILSMEEGKLEAYIEAEALAPYKTRLLRLKDQKAHTLSQKEEKILAGASEILASPSMIDDMLADIDLRFEDVKDGEGNTVPVTQATFIPLQENPDRVLRENAFRSYYKSFKEHINTFGVNYAASVKGDIFTARTRNYESAREMAAAHERVPASIYENLITAVRKHLPSMHRYAALRKKILGVPELHYYDLYAPLAKDVDLSYSYEEAKEMVLGAVAPFGEEYTETVKRAFKERWVDVYPNVGKRGGAYSGGTYDSNPYIMMNFTGSVDSVSTLAHEMGHSMHSYFSHKNQPPQYAYYKIFVAEVASTVNENLMIEKMLKENSDPALRLYLLNQYLENFKGTVYRQTMFAEFEKIAYEKQEAGEALTAESLCRIYEELVKDYFGEALVVDEEVRYEWARIPHFYSAFYVYKYATSYCAAVALSDAIQKDPEHAVAPYLQFLSLGDSGDPLESLQIAGVDMSDTAPIERALDKFELILQETEALVKELL